MKYFYINLNRRPDRKEHMEKQFSNAGINNYERFEALDGKILQSFNVTLEEICLFEKADFKHRPNTKLLMGNQLSHIRSIRKFLESDDEYCVIMQDDMVFCNNFSEEVNNIINNLPQDVEIINIGFHHWACLAQCIPYDLSEDNTEHIDTKVNDYVCKLKGIINPCSSAYIITRDGANKFIEHVLKNGCHSATDWIFNNYLINKNIFYGSVKVLCTGSNMGSDIFI
tara:strand:- start:1291 stop:1968 length:678 start_codon:yes stop_codon:yes gene_type:complete